MADEKKRDDDLIIDMGDRKGRFDSPSRTPQGSPPAPPITAAANNPIFPVLSYCASSILMTVTNKFVLSGSGFNLNFFLLAVQVSEKSSSTCSEGLMLSSPLSALLPSKAAKHQVSSPIATSIPMRPENVCSYQGGLKSDGQQLMNTRVSRITPSNRDNIHKYQSLTIPFNPGLHDLQEFDHHLDRIR